MPSSYDLCRHALEKSSDPALYRIQTKMFFIRALYFPRLDDSSRQSPPPRLVKLEVVQENQTWYADVTKFFNLSQVENFIIDGPYQDLTSLQIPCNTCGENHSNCTCTPAGEVEETKSVHPRCDHFAETSYMMAFAATNDYYEDEPLLDREYDSEPEEDCWTRDFLFLKLDAGFPIDIGSTTPRNGNPGANYATMTRDVEYLQKFFVKLVQNNNLATKRFTPGFQAEDNLARLTTFRQYYRFESLNIPPKSKEQLPFCSEFFESSERTIRRTQSARFKSHLIRKPSWSMRKVGNSSPAILTFERPPVTRATTTRLFRLQRQLCFSYNRILVATRVQKTMPAGGGGSGCELDPLDGAG